MSEKLPDLSALTIVNTRPKGQAKELTQLLNDNGAKVIELPLIEISTLTDTLNTEETLQQLNQAGVIIFISANAVIHFMQWLAQVRHNHNHINDPIKKIWKTRKSTPSVDSSLKHEIKHGINETNHKAIKWATVGRSTAKALQKYSQQYLGERISADIVPEQGSDSESLLQCAELQQTTLQQEANRNIVIVRGRGGREYLAEQLRHRGARVEYLELYQRCAPQREDANEQQKIIDIWQKPIADVVVITSSEGLVNLITLLGGALYHLQEHLPNQKQRPQMSKRGIDDSYRSQALSLISCCKLLAVHQKIADKAHKMGFKQDFIIAEKATNEAILEALIRYSE